jgi:sugar phosphate isomerase/epimerase
MPCIGVTASVPLIGVTSSAPLIGVTASSLGNPPFAELVDIAGEAGFGALSLWPRHTYTPALAEGWTPAGMRAALDDHGLVVHDVDALVAWVGPDDPGTPYFEESTPTEIWESAEALGARCVNVLLTGRRRTASHDDAAEVLAAICDQAADRGLLVTVEFALRSVIDGFAEAVAVCRTAGRPNARICLDTWAVHYGAIDLAQLQLEAARVATVQINDAPATPPEDLRHATRYHRLVPGDGTADLGGIVRALRSGGGEAPLVAEVFNDEQLAAVGVEAFARRLYSTVKAIDTAAQ